MTHWKSSACSTGIRAMPRSTGALQRDVSFDRKERKDSVAPLEYGLCPDPVELFSVTHWKSSARSIGIRAMPRSSGALQRDVSSCGQCPDPCDHMEDPEARENGTATDISRMPCGQCRDPCGMLIPSITHMKKKKPRRRRRRRRR